MEEYIDETVQANTGCGRLKKHLEGKHIVANPYIPHNKEASDFAYEPEIDATLDLLADHLEQCIDCDRLLDLTRAPTVPLPK